MVVLGGKVYVIGGFDGLQRINNVETYDPFHNCWSEVLEIVSMGNAVCIITAKPKKGYVSMLVYGLLITRLPLRTFLVAVSFPHHRNHCFSIADQVTALCSPALSWPEPQMCGGGKGAGRLDPTLGVYVGLESLCPQMPSILVFTWDTQGSL